MPGPDETRSLEFASPPPERLRRLREDQAQRWAVGDRIRAEDYLRHIAALSNEELLALILGEIHLRWQSGETPVESEYQERFPQLAEAIREQFPRTPELSTAHYTPKSTAAMVPSSPTGNQLGPYILQERLGGGGMGEVHRAWHQLLRREDAVKTVRPELTANKAAISRFLREAASIAQLRHPNVVQVYTADVTVSGYYIAMEYIPGTNLRKLVTERGPLPVAMACDYIRQATEGIEHAYQRGLVHRDLKPENLLVTEDGQTLKVADFGLARAILPETSGEVTSAGAMLGTPDYMAPEQADDARSADTRSDLYALGCTFYFLLTGTPPYPGGSLREKLDRHANALLPDVTHHRKDVPTAIIAIIHRCMAKRPDERYQTPRELLAALRNVPGEAKSIESPRQRPRWGRWIVAGTTGLATIAGITLILNRDTPETTREPALPERAEDDKSRPAPIPVSAAPLEAILPTGIAVPRPASGSPWKITAACWSKRQERVLAAGFRPDGSIVASRVGWREDAIDSGYTESWPSTGGGIPIHAGRPVDLPDDEQVVGVDANGVVYSEGFLRFDPVTLKSLPSLSRDLSLFARGTAVGIDQLVMNGKNNLVVGSVRPEERESRNRRFVMQWDSTTGQTRAGWQVTTDHNIPAVATDFTGEHVAVGTWEGKITLLSPKGVDRTWTPPQTSRGEANAIRAIALNSAGNQIIVGHVTEPAITVWDTMNDRPLQTLPINWQILRMALSPDDRWLVVVGDNASVWDLKQTPPREYPLTDAWSGLYITAAFSADGRRLLVGGWSGNSESKKGHGIVWVWQIP